MLTESASVRVATPLYIDPSQLTGGARGLETYKEQMNFPNPWPGGWWTLRGVVERQKVSAWATLDLAARNKETVLWNAYLKASRQTERGAKGKPAAYAMSANQHDPLTLNKLVNALLAQGIEVLQSAEGLCGPGRHDVSGRLVLRVAGPAEDGPHPLPARRNALHGQRAHAAARTARRSGPTTWARTCWRSTWASGSTR